MKKTALVILAAGIGSRFGGGIKQLEPVGPNGEIIMDFSIYDALEAGFNKIVFIIRKDLDADFRRIIGERIEKVTEVAYAYQEIDDLPEGFSVPEGRKKPWGTGHALLCARDVISEPFAVINADDYYGMAGFVLGNTLSDNGGVTRGICSQDEAGRLIGIVETKNIIRTESGSGAAAMTDDGLVPVDSESLVSMNMWGFREEFLDDLREGFPVFLKAAENKPLSAEYLLPTIVDDLLKSGKADVSVLKTDDKWFGVTYKEDKDSVKKAFEKLVSDGVYESPLFG